jgi:orotidine-5'-phosphate decarboxylase
MTFAERLDASLDHRGSVCVGIDPHAQLLRDWGLGDDVAGLERFAGTCVDAFAGTAAVVKPQSAFFERFGSAGIAVLERTVADCRAAGAIVVLDVKRGDIGSTMAAYADAYLDAASPLAADAITVSPYLGVGSLEPAFATAQANDAGVFVLCLTSNPEGAQVQHATGPGGVSVAAQIVADLAARNGDRAPMGDFGIVVGATIGDSVVRLDALNGPYLVPGVGAQGGTPADVKRLFAAASRNVVPSVSREVLRVGPDLRALRDAVAGQVDSFAFLRG